MSIGKAAAVGSDGALPKKTVAELEEELEHLREENKFFLKQVSEDFEELVFLRLIAERLALGSSSYDVNELVDFMMPMLGEAVSVEEMYYIEGNAGSVPRIAKQWFSDLNQGSLFNSRQIEELVEHFRAEAGTRPVVKNLLNETGLYPELPELREFVLVAVSTAMGPIGWLLAVNKHQLPEVTGHEPLWRQSLKEFGTSEASFMSTASAMLASYTHNVAFTKEREGLLVSVVRSFVSAIESKDTYTCGHSERVARYARRVAEEVGYDREACERLYLTGLLHDVGKIGVSDAILKKDGALTDEEFAEIQKHPELGWAILRGLEPLSYVLPGVLHHHERVDGKGYPDELRGEEIPRDGQLLAVVDAFDAMTSDRPYRKGMPVEKAVKIFKEGAGSQWDSVLVEVFLEVLPDILSIRDSYVLPVVPIRQKKNGSCKEITLDGKAAGSQPVYQST